MKKPYAFISYSSKESDVANLVHSYLEGNGVSCWIASRNIEGGESFAAQIVDAIGDCSAFVMIASAQSNDSGHVSNELSLAFGAKKKIIPFRLQNYELSKSNIYFLQQAQWIDADVDMNQALQHLLKAVRGTMPETEPVAAPIPPAVQAPAKKAALDKQFENLPDLSREEMVNLLLEKIEKFP